MVQVDSGKVRLVDKDDSMMEHWNICFIIFLYHGLKLLRHGHINSISILNILEKDFHPSVTSLQGACLSTNSRRLLSSADPPPTLPTCEQPSKSCGGSRKQSLQRERERSFTRIWIISVVDCFARSFGELPTQNDKVKVWSHWILNRCPPGTRIGFSDLCCFLTQALLHLKIYKDPDKKIPWTPIPNQPCTSTYQYLL